MRTSHELIGTDTAGKKVTAEFTTDRRLKIDVGGILTTSTFLSLTDTPSSYAGQSGKSLIVNPGETALIFSSAGSGTVTNTGGSLTANAVVLGAGTNDTKVVAGIITDAVSKLTLGVSAGPAAGAIDFKNVTSGTLTLTPVTGALGANTLSLPAATDTLVGKATTDTFTNKSIDAAQLTGTVVAARLPAFGSGDVSFAAAGGAGTIANDAVTYAKIQNVTTARLLGRATAGSGDTEEITLGTNLSFTGTTLNAAGGGGGGTVTNTGGNLTANAVVLGAGTVDVKVVAGVITDGTSKLTLGVAGTSVGSVDFKNATSGTVTILPATGALGSVSMTLPAANCNPVIPDTGAANNFLTAISAGGVISKAQPTPTNVGLGNVTNNAQTQAAIVPNTAPSAGQVLVGNAGGTAYAPVTMGTDATLASTGALTIANNAVTLAKMATMATDSILGRATAATGNVEVLTALPFAYTGDVTRAIDSNVTVLANIPTATPAAGYVQFTDIAAPAAGAASTVRMWGDSTDLRFHDKNAAGTIGTTVVADTGSANNFLTAISAAGVISKAQPAFSNLSGNIVHTQMNSGTGASSTTFWRGDDTWATPAGGGTVTHSAGNLTNNAVVLGAGVDDTKVSTLMVTDGQAKLTLGGGISVGTIDFKNATSGAVTITPTTGALGAVSMTLPAANSNPVIPDTGAANNFLTAISAGGVISKAQPDFTNLSGDFALTQTPSLAADKLVGRGNGGGAGDWQAITLGTNLSMTGATLNAAGGGGTPGGSNTQVQYNNSSAFGGITNATTDGTTMTLTSPKVVTNIKDTNANVLLGITATGSAVNDLTIANSATATVGGTIGAEGTGTNLDIIIQPKGGGAVRLGQAVSSESLAVFPTYGGNADLPAGVLAGSAVGHFSFFPSTTNVAVGSTVVLGYWNGGGRSAVQVANVASGNSSLLLMKAGGVVQINSVNTAIAENASGVLEINNGTQGVFRDLIARTVNATSGYQVNSLGGTAGQALVSDSTKAVFAYPPDVTLPDYGTPYTIPDGAEMSQPDETAISSTMEVAVVGTGEQTIFDPANNTPRKGTSSPQSFIMRAGEGLIQYLELALYGNTEGTMTEDASAFLTDFTPGSELVLAGYTG